MVQHRRGSARSRAADLAVGRCCRLRQRRIGDCHGGALPTVCRRHAPAEELGLVAGFNRCRDKHIACDQYRHSRRVCFTGGLLVDCADRHRRLSPVAVRTRGSQASQCVEWSVTRAETARSDAMTAFPPAEEGMTRHVIRLPKQQDESAFRVELIIGKTVKTDASNSYFFAGTLETETIPGWGFDRYILRKLGPMAGTLMAVDPNAPQVERFISIGGEARLLRYNSRVPLVVYVPDGVEVRYRLWRAEANVARAERG